MFKPLTIRPGAQVINYSHLFPTRYAIELEGLKGTVASETFKEPSQREDAKKTIKKLLEERYTSGKNKWFFQPLRVRCPSSTPLRASPSSRIADDIAFSSEWVGLVAGGREWGLRAFQNYHFLHVHHMFP